MFMIDIVYPPDLVVLVDTSRTAAFSKQCRITHWSHLIMIRTSPHILLGASVDVHALVRVTAVCRHLNTALNEMIHCKHQRHTGSRRASIVRARRFYSTTTALL